MTEILRAEQPCILCGMALQVVTLTRDEVTGEERIDRVNLDHPMIDCLGMLKLYDETWPTSRRRSL